MKIPSNKNADPVSVQMHKQAPLSMLNELLSYHWVKGRCLLIFADSFTLLLPL